MNAINFIKQHGVDKARKVVEGAPAFPVFGYCTVTGSYIFKRANATAYYHNETNSWSEEYAIELISLEELKRLVDSIYLVKEHYTLERAKKYADSPYTAPEIKERLEQAIADYKDIFGGEHV